MTAPVTILQQEITREEQLVGLPSDQPLTDASLVQRRVQIAVLLGLLGLVSLIAMFAATGSWRLVASIFALGFGYYALEKEQHLQRLERLRGDATSSHWSSPTSSCSRARSTPTASCSICASRSSRP